MVNCAKQHTGNSSVKKSRVFMERLIRWFI
jgi:hypothetical protein